MPLRLVPIRVRWTRVVVVALILRLRGRRRIHAILIITRMGAVGRISP